MMGRPDQKALTILKHTVEFPIFLSFVFFFLKKRKNISSSIFTSGTKITSTSTIDDDQADIQVLKRGENDAWKL